MELKTYLRVWKDFTLHAMKREMCMNKNGWKNIVFWVIVSEAIGLLAGLLTRNGTELYGQMAMKPPLSPPGWLFPVVWTILYALMGVGAGLVSGKPPSADRNRSINLMVAQLVENFFGHLKSEPLTCKNLTL